jgi:NADPH:quinone reductase-like Zn-dependent oxidoreductase
MDIPAGTPVFGFGLRLEQPLAKLPEQIQISEAQTAVRPANLDAAQAAVMATPGSLACKAVCRLINVRAGQRVMVVDADCPVGWNVVRLLSGLGAEAVAMVDADGFERMKRAGADLIVNKRVLRPERITGSCDAVVDLSPTARPVSYLPCIARGGTLVSRDLLPERELLEAFGLRGVRLTPAIDKELLTTLAYLIEEHILIPFVVPTGRLAL